MGLDQEAGLKRLRKEDPTLEEMDADDFYWGHFEWRKCYWLSEIVEAWCRMLPEKERPKYGDEVPVTLELVQLIEAVVRHWCPDPTEPGKKRGLQQKRLFNFLVTLMEESTRVTHEFLDTLLFTKPRGDDVTKTLDFTAWARTQLAAGEAIYYEEG